MYSVICRANILLNVFLISQLKLLVNASSLLSSPGLLWQETHCGRIFEVPELRLNASGVSLRSKLQCALKCAELELCGYFNTKADGQGKLSCELAKEGAPALQATIPPGDGEAKCYKLVKDFPIDQATCEENYLESSQGECLHKSKWQRIIDTAVPSTQTEDHMISWSHVKEANIVLHDATSGVFTALLATTVIFPKGVAFSVGAMEHNEDGFVDRASRLVYYVRWDGKVHLGVVPPDAAASRKILRFSSAHFYVQNSSSFTKEFEPSEASMGPLIANLHKGYSCDGIRYAKVDDTNTTASFYMIDRRMSHNNGVLVFPLIYSQLVTMFPRKNMVLRHEMGVPRGSVTLLNAGCNSMVINFLWKAAVEDSMPVSQRFVEISRFLTQGRQFRVAVGRARFFDVDIVIELDQEMYFILPQQALTPSGKGFDKKTIGVRAMVSLSGNLFSCYHRLEGTPASAVVFESDSVTDNVRTFVDRKFWSAVLSVYSNGTVAFGGASDVADAATTGHDVGVLVEWLAEDRKQLLKTRMVTVRDYNTPEVVVNAESAVAWHLTKTSAGSVVVNEDCDMEKMWMSSDGRVQRLVYNTNERKPVVNEVDTKTTWFTY